MVNTQRHWAHLCTWSGGRPPSLGGLVVQWGETKIQDAAAEMVRSLSQPSDQKRHVNYAERRTRIVDPPAVRTLDGAARKRALFVSLNRTNGSHGGLAVALVALVGSRTPLTTYGLMPREANIVAVVPRWWYVRSGRGLSLTTAEWNRYWVIVPMDNSQGHGLEALTPALANIGHS